MLYQQPGLGTPSHNGQLVDVSLLDGRQTVEKQCLGIAAAIMGCSIERDKMGTVKILKIRTPKKLLLLS